MKLTEHEIKLIDSMIEAQKSSADRCKQLKGSIPRGQRKKNLERAELLEQVKNEREDKDA